MKTPQRTRVTIRWGMTLAAVVGGIFLWHGAFSTASQEHPAGAFTKTIDVKVLGIEAVVMDRDGGRVAALEKGDFRLMVDGQEVPIEYFSEVRGGTYVQSIDDIPVVRAGQRSPTSFLIFIDEFFAMPNDKPTVLRAIRDRMPRMGDGDQVAVVAWDGKELVMITSWSSSVEGVVAALNTAIERPAQGLKRDMERRQYDVTLQPEDMWGGGRGDSFDRFRLGTQERIYADLLGYQIQGVVGAATAAMRNLASPPGRKVMVLLSGGWPMDVARFVARDTRRAVTEPNMPGAGELYGALSATANLLGYTIYGVDMPGLQQTAGVNASRTTNMGTNTSFIQSNLEDEYHQTLHFLSSETGGTALINGQRITSFPEIGSDVSSFYWLGITPQWQGDDSYHDIRVEVVDPELMVRSRNGYQDQSPTSQLVMAMESSLVYGPFNFDNELQLDVKDVVKAGRKKVEVTIEITAPADKFQAYETPDGWRIDAVLFIAALDKDGGRSDVQPSPLVWVNPAKAKPGMFIRHNATLTLLKKTSRVTVAIYDAVGGESFIGTLAKE